MKKYIGTALLGASIAVIATVMVSGISASPFNATEYAPAATGYIMGHVTLTAYDEFGNIKAYQQSDNLVVNDGEDCAVEILFDNNPGTSDICGATSAFQAIAIGTGSTAAADNDTTLETETTRDGYDSAAFTAATDGTGAIVVIEKDFTGVSATITESGILNNNSTNGDLFARQVFSGIPLTSGDTLNVEWTIDIGGA